MGVSSHDEDHEQPVLLCARPIQSEDEDIAVVDRGLWEKLEELELREDPAELGGMVHQVKQELLGVKDVSCVSSFRQAMDTAHDLSLPVRKMHPKLYPPGQSTGASALAQSPLRSLTSCGAAIYGGRGEEQEISVKFIFEKLMDRLAHLERRLDKWNSDQQRRLEQVIHGKALVLGHGNGHRGHGRAGDHHSSEGRVGKRLEEKRHDRKSVARETKSQHRQADHAAFESTSKDEPQPEREQSPLQEEESTTNGHSSHQDHNGGDHEEYVANGSWAVAAGDEADQNRNGERRSSSAMAKVESRRSSNFVMLTHPDGGKKCSRSETEETETPKKKSILSPLVTHPAFDYFFAAVIMLNSLYIGVQTHWRVTVVDNPWEPHAFYIIERIFAALFFTELMLRIIVAKCDFFALKNITWNLFDSTLVTMSVIEIIIFPLISDPNEQEGGGGGGNIGKVIRMFRMVRIIRIMRVLRFLAELRVMVTLIIHSVRSLFWLLMLLIIILYVFSIFFTQGITDFLTEETTDPVTEKVLNIVTGVFVDGAIQRSAQERDLRLEKEKEQKKVYVSMLMDLLEEIDSAGTGVITRAELEDAFKSDMVKYSFSVLDIDIADSNYLFDMLDLDGSGEVDMEEFVSGCLRLKGNAKSIDIHTLMFEVKHLMNKVEGHMRDKDALVIATDIATDEIDVASQYSDNPTGEDDHENPKAKPCGSL